jgi:hypothetical protein
MAVLELDNIAPPVISARTAMPFRAQTIRGEYLEIPHLSLTRTQVQSFWDLDDDECEAVLEGLLASGFLKMTSSGGFVRA